MKRNRFGIPGSLLALSTFALLGAALPALADDATIEKKIEERLDKARLTTVGDIDVTVKNGEAVLTGAVTTVAAQREVEKLARKDAKFVQNDLVVVPVARPDVDIKKDVLKALLTNPKLGVFDSIDYGVDKGVVVLQGSVLRPDRKDEVEDAMTYIPGVREVRDDISVEGLSPFDEGLRRQIYQQVYGQLSSALAGRDGVNPPVRIIVDRGRVVLTGYVASNVDRVIIGNIARGTLAFDVDNRIKVDGEPPATDRRPESAAPAIVI